MDLKDLFPSSPKMQGALANQIRLKPIPTESLRWHHASIDANNAFTKQDDWIDLTDEPDHQELCNREQAYFMKAIQDDIDLTDHVEDAVNSLRIAFACDESVRTGEVVKL